jgi:hypothetical protein
MINQEDHLTLFAPSGINSEKASLLAGGLKGFDGHYLIISFCLAARASSFLAFIFSTSAFFTFSIFSCYSAIFPYFFLSYFLCFADKLHLLGGTLS